jgi:hypothetical protein
VGRLNEEIAEFCICFKQLCSNAIFVLSMTSILTYGPLPYVVVAWLGLRFLLCSEVLGLNVSPDSGQIFFLLAVYPHCINASSGILS